VTAPHNDNSNDIRGPVTKILVSGPATTIAMIIIYED
jgi:hypothetical protein